jgi:hypothetical protein
MVTIRCPACGNVKLLSKDDYEAYKKNKSDEIYCKDNAICRQDNPKKGMLMVEINSNELKCDSCGVVIKRQNTSDGGKYYCLSVNNTGSGIMCNTGNKGDRQLFCSKICAIAHCDRFISGPMAGRCEALEHYKEYPNASPSDLKELCENCDAADACLSKCRLYGDGVDAIASCMTCREATCRPRPHVIDFNEKWEAECPGCKGKLKPVVARTFETYIRSAFDYQQDGGKSFCDNFADEADKVSLIQEILANDDNN